MLYPEYHYKVLQEFYKQPVKGVILLGFLLLLICVLHLIDRHQEKKRYRGEFADKRKKW